MSDNRPPFHIGETVIYAPGIYGYYWLSPVITTPKEAMVVAIPDPPGKGAQRNYVVIAGGKPIEARKSDLFKIKDLPLISDVLDKIAKASVARKDREASYTTYVGPLAVIEMEANQEVNKARDRLVKAIQPKPRQKGAP